MKTYRLAKTLHKIAKPAGILLVAFVLVCATLVFAKSTSHNPVVYVKDSAITGVIKTKMKLDKHLISPGILINTNNGVVTISGSVNSDIERTSLINVAKNTYGVKNVNTANLFIKKSSQPFTDFAITAKVKGNFLRAKLFDKKDVPVTRVSVTTNNGIVYLSGTVTNKEQASNAIDLAKATSGVIKVDSSIKQN